MSTPEGQAYADARNLGMSHEDAEHEASLTTKLKPITCPEPGCGRTYFRRVVSGTYTAVEYIETTADLIDGFDETDIETDVMDSMGWKCATGHPVPDDIADQLEERRP